MMKCMCVCVCSWQVALHTWSKHTSCAKKKISISTQNWLVLICIFCWARKTINDNCNQRQQKLLYETNYWESKVGNFNSHWEIQFIKRWTVLEFNKSRGRVEKGARRLIFVNNSDMEQYSMVFKFSVDIFFVTNSFSCANWIDHSTDRDVCIWVLINRKFGTIF